MTRRAGRSLLRAAPGRLLSTPGWFLLMAAGVAMLTAAVVAPVLFLRSSSDAALRAELAAVDQDAFASTSSGVRATWQGVLPPAAQRTVVRAVDALPGFGRPTLQALGTSSSRSRDVTSVVLAGTRKQPSTLYYRDGAVETLDPDGTAPPGVWLDRDVAAALGVRAGDTVAMGLDRPTLVSKRLKKVPVTVAGTFRTGPGTALPAAVAKQDPVAAIDLPWDRDRPGVGSPVAVADQATFARLAHKEGEAVLWTLDRDLVADISPARAGRAAHALQRLADLAFDENSQVAQATAHSDQVSSRLEVVSGLPDIVASAVATADAARDQSAAFVSAGVALGLAVVCAAAVLLGRSRRLELELMAGLGMRPAEVTGLAVLEAVAPAVLGATVGAALAWVTVDALGPPGEFREGALTAVAGRAVAGAVAALLLVAACAAVTAWLADRRTTAGLTPQRRRVPWEIALAVATFAAGVTVATTAPARRPSTPLAVAFPVLLAAVVAFVVLWLLRLAGRRLTGTRSRSAGGPRWLAGQRARAGAKETTATALIVAVGLAVLGYSLEVHRGVTQGVDDKVAALVGTRTVVDVGRQLAHKRPARLPASPVPGGTVVWRQLVTMPPSFGGRPLLAVDRRTFAAVADWGSTGRLDPGRTGLHELGSVHDKLLLPVVIAGEGAGYRRGDRGILNAYDDWTVAFTVVRVVPAFPGSESEVGDVAVVTDAKRLFAMIRGFDPTVFHGPSSGAGEFSAEVWSRRSSASVAAALRTAGLTPGHRRLREQARTDSRLLAASWSSGYVVALGAGAVLLVGAAVLLLAVRLADRDRVSDVLLRRMGFSRRDLALARTWEVAAVVGSALLAAAVAVGVLALAPSMVEPDVAVPPLVRPFPGLPDFLMLALVGLAMVLAAAAVAWRRAGHITAAEVLRGNG